MFNNIYKTIFLLATFFICNPAFSVEKNTGSAPILKWATVGFGFLLSEEANSIGQGFLVGVAVQKGRNVFILRGNMFDDENALDTIFGDNDDCSLPNLSATLVCINEVREFKNIGVLFGRRVGNIVYAVGVEKARGDSTVTFSDLNTRQIVVAERKIFSDVGIALEAQIHVLTRKFTGLAFLVTGNLNKESPYIGVSVNLRIGRVK